MRLSIQTQLQTRLGDDARRAREALEQAQRGLSTGRRINKAADDAAGLAVSTSLRAMQRSLAQAQRNALDAVSLLQVAEQGASTLTDLTLRARELAVQAANGALSDRDRAHLAVEYGALLSEMDRISKSTRFNGQSLIDLSASALGAIPFQIDASANPSGRLEVNLRSMALGSLGRTDLDAGASLLSQGPLAPFTIAPQPEEATLVIGQGPFTISDTAELIGTRVGPFVVDGVARLEAGQGPFALSSAAELIALHPGPFEIPAPARLEGRASAGYDVVAGENDTLTLRVDGALHAVSLEPGYWSVHQLSRRIDEQIPGVVSVERDRLVFAATGPIGEVEIVGGTALSTLGFAVGQRSLASNGLQLSTSAGSALIYLDPGTWTADALAARINQSIPGLASTQGDRLRLALDQPGAQIRVLKGSANALLGLTENAVVTAQDRLRYRVGLNPWTTLNLGGEPLSAQDVADRINAATPGVARVEQGRLVLEATGPDARLRVDTGEAVPLLGFAPGAYDSAYSGLTLSVGGVARSAEIPNGTWTAAQIAGFVNALSPGVADVFNGRLRLRGVGDQADLALGTGTLHELLGFALNATATAPNLLRFQRNDQIFSLRLTADANTPQGLVDAINAAAPGLAHLEQGQVVLRHTAPGARIEILDGSANRALGLTNGLIATAPVQGEEFLFTLNGEPRAVRFGPGEWSPEDIVRAINRVQVGVASLVQGRLRLAPISVGHSNTLTIGAGAANARLGLTEGQSATGVDTDSLALTQITSVNGARAAMDKLDRALADLSSFRADLGAALNHVLAAAHSAASREEITSAARARIEDADVARLTAQAVQADIRAQMSTALHAAARALASSVSGLYDLLG